jgi:hypothetical protein
LSNSEENSIPALQTNQATANKARVSNGPRQVIKRTKNQMKKTIFIADQQHFEITYNHIMKSRNHLQFGLKIILVLQIKLMGDRFSSYKAVQ